MSGSRVDEGINKSTVLSGAKITFFLGDMTTPVAYGTQVNYTVNYELVPIHCIDRLAPVEHAETATSVSFSVSRFRVPKVDNKPGTGSPVELGWQSKLQNIFTQGTIKARLYDKVGQQNILVIDEVKMASRSGSVAARDIANETLEFVGIIAYDEAGEQNAI